MLAALEAEDLDAAEALLYPDMLQGDNEEGLRAMAQLLDGRDILICTQTSVNISNNVGTDGSARTETGTVSIGLVDGTDMILDYLYFADGKGEGFMRFRLSVGI